jgi:hypothetical protein
MTDIMFPNNVRPLSLLRNGVIRTTGLSFIPLKDETLIHVYSTRGRISRGFIAIADDKDTLQALAHYFQRRADDAPRP